MALREERHSLSLLLGAITGTVSLQNLHILLKSEILLIRSHWEGVCGVNVTETWIVPFEV